MNKLACLITAASLLGGCASIVSGTTDDVVIETEPASGAECTVYRSGDVIGRVKPPQTLNVRRTGAPLLAVCQAGELSGREVIESGQNWWWLGNVLFIAPPAIIVGILVDSVSGAWHGYDNVKVKLSVAQPG